MSIKRYQDVRELMEEEECEMSDQEFDTILEAYELRVRVPEFVRVEPQQPPKKVPVPTRRRHY